MIRWIVGLIACLVFIMVLTNTQTQHAIKSTQQTLSNWISTAAKVPDISKLNILREEFLHNNLSLQPHQTDYISEITSSVEELRKYYFLYCVKGDKNPFIYGANKAKLCEQIKQSSLIE